MIAFVAAFSIYFYYANSKQRFGKILVEGTVNLPYLIFTRTSADPRFRRVSGTRTDTASTSSINLNVSKRSDKDFLYSEVELLPKFPR